MVKKSILFLLIAYCTNILSQAIALQPFIEYQKYNYFNQESPYAIAFHPKKDLIAISTNDDKVKVINFKKDSIWEYKAPTYKGAPLIAYTPDGNELIFTKYLSGSDIAIFDANDYQLKQNIKVDKESVYDFILSKEGKTIITTGSEGTIKLFTKLAAEWDLFFEIIVPQYSYKVPKSESNSASFDASSGEVSSNQKRKLNLHFAQNNKLFCSEIVYKKDDIIKSVLRIFETGSKKNKAITEIEIDGEIKSANIHPNGKDLVIGTNKELIIFELVNNQLKRNRSFIDFTDVEIINFDGLGKYVMLSISNSIKICKWDAQSLKVINDIDLARSSVYTAFSNDNKYFACNVYSYGTIVWKTGLVANPSNATQKTGSTSPKKLENVNTTNTSLAKGTTHLFMIGIDDYKDYPKLSNAKKDAVDVRKQLLEKYNIDEKNCKSLLDKDATSKNILDAFNDYVENLGENDQLLIYYSGHGHYNKQLDEGYWIPVDATKGKELDFLPNSTIVKYLKAFPARHVFLVVDACFSGSLMSSGTRGFLENVSQFKSRWALTSGRYEAVSDGVEGKNSPFAEYFMKYLKENTSEKFAVSQLVNYVKQAVGNNAEQTPWGNAIRNAGDEGGEFIFEIKK